MRGAKRYDTYRRETVSMMDESASTTGGFKWLQLAFGSLWVPPGTIVHFVRLFSFFLRLLSQSTTQLPFKLAQNRRVFVVKPNRVKTRLRQGACGAPRADPHHQAG